MLADEYLLGGPASMAKEPELVTRNRRLADAGDAVAQFNLGNMYRIGYQVKADRDQAVKWLTLAAAQGNGEAIALLSQMGVDLPVKPEIVLLSPAEEMFDLPPAEVISDPLSFDQVAEDPAMLQAAARSGLADAQIALGNAYRTGAGVPADLEEALRWYRLAADQGSAPGQCAVGMMYDQGLGVLQNIAEAKAWYTKAARQGDARAQFNLGNMIRQGRGGAPNPEVAGCRTG
jgi:TPR repeat protein